MDFHFPLLVHNTWCCCTFVCSPFKYFPCRWRACPCRAAIEWNLKPRPFAVCCRAAPHEEEAVEIYVCRMCSVTWTIFKAALPVFKAVYRWLLAAATTCLALTMDLMNRMDIMDIRLPPAVSKSHTFACIILQWGISKVWQKWIR